MQRPRRRRWRGAVGGGGRLRISEVAARCRLAMRARSNAGGLGDRSPRQPSRSRCEPAVRRRLPPEKEHSGIIDGDIVGRCRPDTQTRDRSTTCLTRGVTSVSRSSAYRRKAAEHPYRLALGVGLWRDSGLARSCARRRHSNRRQMDCHGIGTRSPRRAVARSTAHE